MADWLKAQEWEKNWWGNCCNTWQEELKQTVYVAKMHFPYDLDGKSVIDVGGGPVSLLLKTTNKGKAVVVDPCDFPDWVGARYREAGIEYRKEKGEQLDTSEVFDIGLCYNVLQHTEDPELVVKNLKSVSRVIYLFEWLETEENDGHPHRLEEKDLNKWLDGIGKTEQLNELGCVGKAYYGVFMGNRYEKV